MRLIYTLIFSVLFPALAYGAVTDSHIPDAKLCTQEFARQERHYGIPGHLLAAIANTETGRWHAGLGVKIPWPWTINAEGQGYFFESKQEAMAKVRALQRQGMQSIDIGCMQVNLKHHRDAFASLSDAFDPHQNVAYAAKFLRSNYAETGNWQKAASAYHSRTPKYAQAYLEKLAKEWGHLVKRIREARMNRYVTKVSSAADTDSLWDGKQGETRKSFKIIEVKDAPATRSSKANVMVIRPTTQKKSDLQPIASPTHLAAKEAPHFVFEQ